MPLPHDPGPHWGEVGIHGLHRQRVWDVFVTVAAPELPGDESWFVVLDDGIRVVEDGASEVAPLAAAVALEPPFRAHAVRHGDGLWAVAATAIETVVLEHDPGGNSVELSWDGVERSVRIDGRPTLSGVAELERLGARHATYVVTAARIVADVWEVAVTPL